MSRSVAEAPSGTLLEDSIDRRVALLAERQLRDTNYQALTGISCDFHDGVAVLRGAVPTFYLKQVAQSVVGKLDEVKQIDNRIHVADAGDDRK
jgi:osmotically-inducible protein OsmY